MLQTSSIRETDYINYKHEIVLNLIRQMSIFSLLIVKKIIYLVNENFSLKFAIYITNKIPLTLY